MSESKSLKVVVGTVESAEKCKEIGGTAVKIGGEDVCILSEEKLETPKGEKDVKKTA